VVTVPAIWLASGKQMMREAAKKAGLCSEQNPDRLSLALEPESGAIYCHQMLRLGRMAYPDSDPSAPPPSYCYLIVDIGGGTVDISAHRVGTTPSLWVEELHHPVGNNWGGLRVNSQFSEYLQKMVHDRSFTRYLHVADGDARIKNRFEMDELLNVVFEGRKTFYCRKRKEERCDVVVKLPNRFLNQYRGDLVTFLEAAAKSLHVEGRDEEAVALEESSLRIPPAKMEQFLAPAVRGITECVDDLVAALARQGVGVHVIYLVGGFGGCRYIYDTFCERYGQRSRVFAPPHPEHAVVEGAVLFRANPAIVRSRRADATYGKSVTRHFVKGVHDERFREGEFCHDLFQTIVSVGESVRPDYLYQAISRPLALRQREICFKHVT
jgi:hypothetical protein